MARIPKLDAAGKFLAADVNAQIDARTKATMRADLPALAKELKIGGGGVDGAVPIFPTLAGAVAWEAANPGKVALTIENVAPDTTAPTPGNLGVAPSDKSARLTVTGEWDDRGVTGYAFKVGTGSWSAWQDSNEFTATGLTAATSYTFTHKVRDRAGNEAVGGPVTSTTLAAPLVKKAPNEISGLLGWWDASDASTLTVQDGAVTAWAAKNSSTHKLVPDAAQTSPVTLETVSGKGALRYGAGTGASKLAGAMPTTGSAPLVYWGVFRVDDLTIQPTLFGHPAAEVGVNPANRTVIIQGSAVSGLAAEQGTLYFAAIEVNNGATAKARLNSKSVTHTINRAGSASVMNTGASKDAQGRLNGPLHGVLCEIGVHAGVMSTGDWDALWAYMAEKWSIGA